MRAIVARSLALAVLVGGCADDIAGPAPVRGPLLSEVPAVTAFNGEIRIGVVPTATSVSLGSAGSWELVEKSTERVALTGTGGTVAVTLVAPPSVQTIWRLQVVCTTVAGRDARTAALLAAGYLPFVELAPAGCWRVLITNTSGSNTFASRNAFRNTLIAAGFAGTDSFWRQFVEVSPASLNAVRAGSTVTVFGAAVLRPANGVVTIQGVPYRGVAEATANSAGSLAGVNQLHIEQYLYGVVPRELPPTIWNQLEAQKAQAVAARTYALRGLGKRAADGYDLLATTADQVYGGLNAEHPLSTQAVDETANIVATHNGLLIEALFSSTSGGHTAGNEEVFNSAPVAYLRGVPDAQRGAAFAHVPSLEIFRAHGNPKSLRALKHGDFESDWSQFHRWTFEWSADEISDIISAFAGTDVGTVQSIDVLERGPSGRVLRIAYVTDAGTFFDTKDHVRSSLKFVTANGTWSNLLSTLFYIEPVLDRRTGEVDGFRAFGGGWGHGVGLSQTGVAGMADKNARYEEILLHYYQGIELQTWAY
jgi:SpoIID/LytB domain protein